MQVEREKESVTHQLQDMKQENTRLKKANANLKKKLKKKYKKRCPQHRRGDSALDKTKTSNAKSNTGEKEDSVEKQNDDVPSLLSEGMTSTSLNPSNADLSLSCGLTNAGDDDHRPTNNELPPSVIQPPAVTSPPLATMPFTYPAMPGPVHQNGGYPLSPYSPPYYPSMMYAPTSAYGGAVPFNPAGGSFMATGYAQGVGNEESWTQGGHNGFIQDGCYGDRGEGAGGGEAYVPFTNASASHYDDSVPYDASQFY